jgi:lipid A 3-O-deacylase PagL
VVEHDRGAAAVGRIPLGRATAWRIERLRVRLVIIVAFLATGTFATLSAQTTGSQDDSWRPRWHVGPYVGVARHSLVGTHLGVTPDRNHLLIGLHATARFVRSRRWILSYAPDVAPLLLISNNPRYRHLDEAGGGRITVEDGRGAVTGFAISPIGLEAQIQLTSRWRAYTAGAAGVVWFTREVPTAYSRAFNYTFEVGGGVLWRYRSRNSLRVGYKFHHLSNLYTAPNNPGIDGAVFLLGFERAIGSHR